MERLENPALRCRHGIMGRSLLLEHGLHSVQLLAEFVYLHILQIDSVGTENERLVEAFVILVLSCKVTKCTRNFRGARVRYR